MAEEGVLLGQRVAADPGGGDAGGGQPRDAVAGQVELPAIGAPLFLAAAAGIGLAWRRPECRALWAPCLATLSRDSPRDVIAGGSGASCHSTGLFSATGPRVRVCAPPVSS